MSRVILGLGAAFVGLVVLGACTAPAPEPGRKTFQAYCAGCHGATAKGDGPVAATLPVIPADLTVLSLSNDGVFPAEHVMATIHGYPGRHDFSVMPDFGPLLNGPKQIWVSPDGEEFMTPVALVELVSYLESIQR